MIQIDLEKNKVTVLEGGRETDYPLESADAFRILSEAWLRAGWDAKYVYGFTWLGRPIIQLPEDLVRIQEVIFQIQPDVIIETGVAHGGSLVFYASLCKAMERGRVIGIDVEIRPPNRRAIETHFLASWITLIEGSSIDPDTIAKVKANVQSNERVVVMLDSCHAREHVLAELRAYAPLVSKGSYLVAMDGIMEKIVGAPRTNPDWTWNNPAAAAREFVSGNPDFAIVEPPFAFNEGVVKERVTYWPDAFIQRLK